MFDASSQYVAIDLGSNSFHMLVVREVAGDIQPLCRIKRKVRLATGLDDNNQLSPEAMERGWQCLQLFAERLQDIPKNQIRAVATATLRLASNAQMFIDKAEQILGFPVRIISGEEEANLIYQGVAHTTGGANRRLVVDIGGASTELVTGSGAQTTLLFSLAMGCVTWLERYFADRRLTAANFFAAESAAEAILQPIAADLRHQGWEICVGASGTVQALQEIMMAQGMDEHITLGKLEHLKRCAIQCGRLEELEIEGLTLERSLVFPSGLAILIAIFRTLSIEKMSLSGGALREGLVYSMLNMHIKRDIRQRTLSSVQRRFVIDIGQARRVAALCELFTRTLSDEWQLDTLSKELLYAASMLHEIGLSVDLKKAPQHASYLVNNMDLPGFTPAQKKLLAVLLLNQTNPIDASSLHQQNALPALTAGRLCRLLRLAILFAGHRRAESTPAIALNADGDHLKLHLPCQWLQQNPLSAELLEQEIRWQGYNHWPVSLN